MSDEPQVEPHQCSVCGGAMGAHTAECKAHSLQRPGYAAGVESETCLDCDRGYVPAWDGEGNEIGEQPCQRCGGTGSIEKAKPQHNVRLNCAGEDPR